MTLTRKKQLQVIILYAAATVFVLTFGLVYEAFGFGVTSPFMHLAFLIPLLAGFLPCLVLFLAKKHTPLTEAGSVLYRLGIATLTVGSLFQGALDIYGTKTPLTAVYAAAGGVTPILSLLSALFPGRS